MRIASSGTGFNAVAAVNTFKQIDIETDRHFFGLVIKSLPCLNHDAVGRTVGLAHKTGNTFYGPVLMGGESMTTAPANRDLGLYLRVVPNVVISVIAQISPQGGQRLWPFL